MLDSVLLTTWLPSHKTWGNTATTQEFLTQGSSQQMGDCRFPIVCTNAPCVAKSSGQCYLAWPTWIFLTFWTFFLTVLLYRNIAALFHFHCFYSTSAWLTIDDEMTFFSTWNLLIILWELEAAILHAFSLLILGEGQEDPVLCRNLFCHLMMGW